MQLAWKERFAIHYQELDEQHRGFFDLLNELLARLGVPGSRVDLTPAFQRLTSYALNHFAREEFYMAHSGFAGLAGHRQAHARFVYQLLEFNRRFRPSDPLLLNELVEFLRTWLIEHIIGLDFEFAPHLRRYGETAPVMALVFDYGNVLASFDVGLFLEKVATGAGKTLAEIERILYVEPGLAMTYERGELTSDRFYEQAVALGEIKLDRAEFQRAYCDIFTPLPGMVALLERLKKRFRLGLLSNTGPWHAEHQIRASDAFPLFDAVTFSFEAGTAKPDRRMFLDILGKLDLMAEQCVFIDDLPGHVAAAGALRFRALRFTTREALIADLARWGVLTGTEAGLDSIPT